MFAGYGYVRLGSCAAMAEDAMQIASSTAARVERIRLKSLSPRREARRRRTGGSFRRKPYAAPWSGDGESSIDIKVSTDDEVSPITGEHVVHQFVRRQTVIVIQYEQTRCCFRCQFCHLGHCRVVLGGKSLKGLRSRRQPRRRVRLVNEHVTAAAGIDRFLCRPRVAQDDDTAILRIEAVAVTLHGVLRGDQSRS